MGETTPGWGLVGGGAGGGSPDSSGRNGVKQGCCLPLKSLWILSQLCVIRSFSAWPPWSFPLFLNGCRTPAYMSAMQTMFI